MNNEEAATILHLHSAVGPNSPFTASLSSALLDDDCQERGLKMGGGGAVLGGHVELVLRNSYVGFVRED